MEYQDVISIIVPIYNSAETLERCVDSILCQTYSNLEIILVDDGSTDNSIDICKRYKDNDDRIKVVNQVNSGVSAARNNGLSHATGKYIQFVDSDDKIAADMCEKLVRRQKDTDADVVLCGYVLLKNNIEKKVCASDTVFTDAESLAKEFPDYLEKFLIHNPWNKLYLRSKIINKFNEEYSLGEDLVFNLQFLEKCQRIAGMSETLYYYIVTETDAKKRREDSAGALYYILKDFIESNLSKDKASLKVANLIYINDRLYNIHLLSHERDGLQKIKRFCGDELFTDIVSTSKKDSGKFYATHLCVKYHLYIILYLYFRLKDISWQVKKQ